MVFLGDSTTLPTYQFWWKTIGNTMSGESLNTPILTPTGENITQKSLLIFDLDEHVDW